MAFDIYPEWNYKKIKLIMDYYGPRSFVGKTMADLGSFHGDISGAFLRLGVRCTSYEWRDENIAIAKKKYPNLRQVKADLSKEFAENNRFDIVLNLGLLPHLENPEEHLRYVCSITDNLVLESECIDSKDPYRINFVSENVQNKEWGITGRSAKLSVAFIERVLRECGFEFKKISETKLNTGKYIYDWAEKDSGAGNIFYRKIWFAKKIGAPNIIANTNSQLNNKIDNNLQPQVLQQTQVSLQHPINPFLFKNLNNNISKINTNNGIALPQNANIVKSTSTFAICLSGSDKNKINIEETKKILDQINNKKEIFIYTTNYSEEDIKELEILNPKKIKNEQSDSNLFFRMFNSNKLKEENEFKTSCVYDCELVIDGNCNFFTLQPFNENSLSIHHKDSNFVLFGSSMMVDMFCLINENLNSYNLSSNIELVRKHLSEYNIPNLFY